MEVAWGWARESSATPLLRSLFAHAVGSAEPEQAAECRLRRAFSHGCGRRAVVRDEVLSDIEKLERRRLRGRHDFGRYVGNHGLFAVPVDGFLRPGRILVVQLAANHRATVVRTSHGSLHSVAGARRSGCIVTYGARANEPLGGLSGYSLDVQLRSGRLRRLPDLRRNRTERTHRASLDCPPPCPLGWS